MLKHLYLIPLSPIAVVVVLSVGYWCVLAREALTRCNWRLRVCADVVIMVALGLLSSVLTMRRF